MDKYEKAQLKFKQENEKAKIKAQNEKERAIKRTLRKARVPKDASPIQAKYLLLNYASKIKSNWYKVKFTDELLSDPKFLLDLYKANPTTTYIFRPNCKNKSLQENIDFMIEYVKLHHNERMKSHMYRENWITHELERVVEDYKFAMSNPVFVERLAQEFPDVLIVPLVKHCLIKNYSVLSTENVEEKNAQDLNLYKTCLSGLPIERLCNEAKRYGTIAIDKIPNDIPNFNKIVSAGIEKDGFESLCLLNINQVLENKDLIIKAYEKQGIKELINYITEFLSPRKTYYYMCHGEPHDYSKYEPIYEEVQKALISDPQIKSIFKKEKISATTQEVKRTYINIESIENNK